MAIPPTSAAGKLDRDLSNVDTINLRLILVNGKTKEFQLPSNSSALDITQYVFDHWPDEWNDVRVNSSSMLKLIYHGRFLHGSVTLGALSLPVGKTAVMHLVTRENLPESSTNDNLKKMKRNACCRCCPS
ncbi:Ubiquitin-like protein 3 [Acanthocheilonema viteae]